MPRPAALCCLLALACGRDKGQTLTDDSALPDSAPLPFGDNLTPYGSALQDGFPLELTGVLSDPAGLSFACAGTAPLQIYDTADLANPRRVGQVNFPPPAGGFRCQHLALMEGNRLVATHHGDETSPPWIALAEVADPAAPVGLSTWSDGVALDGVAVDGTTVYAAAHERGVLVFDASDGRLQAPEPLPNVRGQAVAVALRGSALAVGTLEGELLILDTAGEPIAEIPVAGAVQDILWLDDDSLLVACGAAGVDRVRVSTASVEAHGETGSPALDLAALDDGSVAVAAWSEILVLDPVNLAILGAENPSGSGQEAVVLALDAVGDVLTVGDWQGLLTHRWDPGVSAPELALDVFSIDLGQVPRDTPAAATLILRNRGPRPLDITRVSSSRAGLGVDRAALRIPAYGADFVEVSWVSDGLELRGELILESDDPDEGELRLDVYANRPGVGVGQRLPAFSYLSVNDGQIYDSQSLGAPALLSYFATF